MAKSKSKSVSIFCMILILYIRTPSRILNSMGVFPPLKSKNSIWFSSNIPKPWNQDYVFFYKTLLCSKFQCNFTKLFTFSCNNQGFTKTTTVMLSLYIIAAKLLWPMRRIAIEPLVLFAMILFLQNRKSLQKKMEFGW